MGQRVEPFIEAHSSVSGTVVSWSGHFGHSDPSLPLQASLENNEGVHFCRSFMSIN